MRGHGNDDQRNADAVNQHITRNGCPARNETLVKFIRAGISQRENERTTE